MNPDLGNTDYISVQVQGMIFKTNITLKDLQEETNTVTRNSKLNQSYILISAQLPLSANQAPPVSYHRTGFRFFLTLGGRRNGKIHTAILQKLAQGHSFEIC